MYTNTPFETGAITHTVNELVLYTDTTRNLAETIENIYKKCTGKKQQLQAVKKSLSAFLNKVTTQYIQEFKEDNYHIKQLSKNQKQEFITIYQNRFQNQIK